jgi:hypothetical protein
MDDHLDTNFNNDVVSQSELQFVSSSNQKSKDQLDF